MCHFCAISPLIHEGCVCMLGENLPPRLYEDIIHTVAFSSKSDFREVELSLSSINVLLDHRFAQIDVRVTGFERQSTYSLLTYTVLFPPPGFCSSLLIPR